MCECLCRCVCVCMHGFVCYLVLFPLNLHVSSFYCCVPSNLALCFIHMAETVHWVNVQCMVFIQYSVRWAHYLDFTLQIPGLDIQVLSIQSRNAPVYLFSRARKTHSQIVFGGEYKLQWYPKNVGLCVMSFLQSFNYSGNTTQTKVRVTSRPHRYFNSSISFLALDSGNLSSVSASDIHFLQERELYLGDFSLSNMEISNGPFQDKVPQEYHSSLIQLNMSRR